MYSSYGQRCLNCLKRLHLWTISNGLYTFVPRAINILRLRVGFSPWPSACLWLWPWS